MPTAECTRCGGTLHWRWEEAFDKFGFGDGDGQVMTDTVAQELERHGYAVQMAEWGLHNTVIDAIAKDGASFIPAEANLGIESPRNYLPKEIIALLDAAFPNEEDAS